MQKKNINKKDPSTPYRNLGVGVIKASKPQKDGTRASKISSGADLRASKGR